MSSAASSRVAYAQVFFRNPLLGSSARAGLAHRIADGLAVHGTELRRVMGRWAQGSASRPDDFQWNSVDGAAQVAVHPGHRDNQHCAVAVECPVHSIDLPTLARAVRDLGEWAGADFAHLTVLGDENGVRPTMYLTSRDLSRWLPEIWHGLLLGPPYVDLIGADRIRRAPAHAVEATGQRRFWVGLDAWEAVASDDGDVDAHRRDVCAHLGPDLFWQPERRIYRTPEFAMDPDPMTGLADHSDESSRSDMPTGDLEVR